MSILSSVAIPPAGCVDEILEPGTTLCVADLTGKPGLFGRGRGTRVLMLAALIAVLSAADLYITGLYLATTGMAEENPLARLVMSSGSLGFLSVWKLMTVVPTLAVMIGYRRRLVVELMGWVASAVLVWVMLRWVQYADETHILLIALDAMQNGGDHRWVSLAGPPAS